VSRADLARNRGRSSRGSIASIVMVHRVGARLKRGFLKRHMSFSNA
jgi:hypothetical protein